MKSILTLEDRIACLRRLSASAMIFSSLVNMSRKSGGPGIDKSLEPAFETLRTTALEASAALNGKNYDEESTD